MEMWTQKEGGRWKRWRHPGRGLAVITHSSPGVAQLLLVSTDPADELKLLATIRLARRVAHGPLEVIAGSEQPSPLWLEAVRQAGADRALLVEPPKHRAKWRRPPLEHSIELGAELAK